MLMSLVPTLISLYYMLVFWWGFLFWNWYFYRPLTGHYHAAAVVMSPSVCSCHARFIFKLSWSSHCQLQLPVTRSTDRFAAACLPPCRLSPATQTDVTSRLPRLKLQSLSSCHSSPYHFPAVNLKNIFNE